MSRIDTHVSAVQRKLTLGLFLDFLAMAAFVLGVVAFLLILLDRAFHLGIPFRSLWLGVVIGGGVALILSVWRRPSRESAAVALDERLGLKEKFSTAIAVRENSDPFAQAVVRDAEVTAQHVHLGGQFPMTFPKAGYWAIVAAFVAVLSFMLVPKMDLLKREAKAIAAKEQEREIAGTKEELKKAIATVDAMPTALRENEDVKIARAQLAEMLNRPIPDQSKAARMRMDTLSKMDEAVKQQVAQNKQYGQVQKSLSMFRNMQPPTDAKGPVADAQRNLAKGDFKEAVEDIKKAVDEFDKKTAAEKKETAEQMQQMASQIAAMAQDPRAMQKLQEQLEKNGANKEQAKQLAEKMQQAAQGDKQAQQQLQQMQQQLQQQMANNPQAQQAMQQAMQQAQQAANAQAQAQQMAQAAQQMAQAMGQMAQQGQQQGAQQGGQMAQGAQNMQAVLEQMQAMQQDQQAAQAAQRALQDAMAQAGNQAGGNNPGQGDRPGQGGRGEWDAGDPNRQGNGMGGAGIGNGGVAEKSAAPFGVKQETAPSHYDDKGKVLASMFVKDRSIKGESKAQLQEMLKAGAADEGDDVDDSRADRRSQEVQRRYFQVMEREAAKQ